MKQFLSMLLSLFTSSVAEAATQDYDNYHKPDSDTLKHQFSDIQYRVTRARNLATF